MNYRSLSDSELERLVYATGDRQAQAILAEMATDAVDAFEESERIITEMENETEDYCGKYQDLQAFLAGPIRDCVESALELLNCDSPSDVGIVLENALDAIDAETSL